MKAGLTFCHIYGWKVGYTPFNYSLTPSPGLLLLPHFVGKKNVPEQVDDDMEVRRDKQYSVRSLQRAVQTTISNDLADQQMSQRARSQLTLEVVSRYSKGKAVGRVQTSPRILSGKSHAREADHTQTAGCKERAEFRPKDLTLSGVKTNTESKKARRPICIEFQC
jgi:hypothetical protein